MRKIMSLITFFDKILFFELLSKKGIYGSHNLEIFVVVLKMLVVHFSRLLWSRLFKRANLTDWCHDTNGDFQTGGDFLDMNLFYLLQYTIKTNPHLKIIFFPPNFMKHLSLSENIFKVAFESEQS